MVEHVLGGFAQVYDPLCQGWRGGERHILRVHGAGGMTVAANAADVRLVMKWAKTRAMPTSSPAAFAAFAATIMPPAPCTRRIWRLAVKPPPLAEWIINLGEAAEYMFDHNIFQDNLVGVDFCETMVKETNPGVWAKAQSTASPNGDKHGYKTIADIMTALNPFTGTFYRETLAMSRMTREMFCLMEGRHVHPSTLYPGGVGTVATIQLFTDCLVRLMKYVEFMKKVVPLHDDLFNFFL